MRDVICKELHPAPAAARDGYQHIIEETEMCHMHTKRRKIVSLLIVLLLALQLLPLNTVLAAEDPAESSEVMLLEDAGGSTRSIQDKAVLHETDGKPDLLASDGWQLPAEGLKSSVSIEGVTADAYGNYGDVPAGAKLDLWIAFHLENLEGFEYKAGDYFTIDLPAGLTFNPTAGDVMIKGAARGTWSISGNTLTVTLNDKIEETGIADNIWARINIQGLFQYLEDAGGGAASTKIVFGSQEITITRRSDTSDPKPPAKSAITKENTYNPETNKITWTVNIAPPADLTDAEKADYNYKGFTVTDALTGAHTYADGTFKVGGLVTADPWTTGGNTFSYTFPGDAKGPQTITYETTPLFGGGNNKFSNSVNLNKGGLPAIEKSVTSDMSVDGFFGKTSLETPITDGDYRYVKWTVTLQVPATPGHVYTYNLAQIVDTIPADGKHSFVIGESSYPVEIKYPGDSAARLVAPSGDAATSGTVGVSGNTLTYGFPSGGYPTTGETAQTYTLTYYTKFDWTANAVNNGEVNLTNEAKFEWQPVGGSGVGGWNGPGVVVTKPIVASGGLISKKTLNTGTFEHSADPAKRNGDYLKWEVTVNGNKIPMGKDTYITDAVTKTDGQEFVIGAAYPLSVSRDGGPAQEYTGETVHDAANTNGALTLVTDYSGGFRFDFPDPAAPATTTTSTYKVTFYTKITDAGLSNMYKNGSKTFNNVAELYGSTGHATAPASITYSLQMLDKAAGTYDYGTRIATWSLAVNRNRLQMNSSTLTDYLPDGMVLSPEGRNAFKIKVNGAAAVSLADLSDIGFAEATNPDASGGHTKGFTLTFPAGADKYEITYTTHIEDSALLTAGDKTFENQSSLVVNNGTAITDNASETITNNVIKKSTDYVTALKDDVINWSVEINPAKIALKNAVVTDTLLAELKLDLNSVYLYKAHVTSSTNPKLVKDDSTKQQVTLASGNLVTGVGLDGKEFFQVKLPDGAESYVLEFKTNVVSGSVTVSNTVTLTGDSDSAAGQDQKTGVSIGDIFSDGSAGAKQLKIQKVDSRTGDPLPGVELQLLRPDKTTSYKNMKATTDSPDGIATFNDVHNWGFYVRETDALPGYLLPDELFGPFRPSDVDAGLGVFVIKNELAQADVSIYKTSSGASPVLLTGGTFELVGTAVYDGAEHTYASKPNADGTITFENVPLGEYVIREVLPPSGYVRTTDTIGVRVDYQNAAAKSGVEVTYSGSFTYTPVSGGPTLYALKNELSPSNPSTPSTPSTAKATVLKTDEAGKPLAGASFTLYDAAGAAVASMVSGADGLAVFVGLSSNTSYTIRETAAPAGYALNDQVISVTTGDGTAQSFTMVDKKISADAGAISVVKTDGAGVPLGGAEFTLYDKDGVAVATRSTDANGKVLFDKLPAGDYTLVETRAPQGYVLDPSGRKITVSKDQTQSVTVSNQREQNKPGAVLGGLRLVKVDSDRHPLSGAEFTLYTADNNPFAKITSGKNGLVVFKDLPVGKYTVRETAAPDGYQLFEEALTVEIPASGATLAYTLKDAALNEDPEIAGWEDNGTPGKLPQTGGASPSFFLLLAGLALTGTGFVLKKTGTYIPKRRAK